MSISRHFSVRTLDFSFERKNRCRKERCRILRAVSQIIIEVFYPQLIYLTYLVHGLNTIAETVKGLFPPPKKKLLLSGFTVVPFIKIGSNEPL